MKKAAPKKQMGGKLKPIPNAKPNDSKYRMKPIPNANPSKKMKTTPMNATSEGSETAKMMMKFGGKTGAPAKRVGGARAYDAQIGKKKGMNKG